jgi:hypothetical protein
MKEVREAISRVVDRKTLAALIEESKMPRTADWFMIGI